MVAIDVFVPPPEVEPPDPVDSVDDSDEEPPPVSVPPAQPASPPSVTAVPPAAVFFRKWRLEWLVLSRAMFATL
jgi:hypothetical protein